MTGFSGKKNLSFFKRYPKALNILTLLVIFSFLPLLVFALQQSQDTRQRAAQQSITIFFNPSENYGSITTAIGLKIPTPIDNTTYNNIIKTFPNGGIYLETVDPVSSNFTSNNFKSLDSKGFKWYFSFSDQNDNSVIPFLQSFFQQFNNDIVVQIKNYNNVTLINNIHNQFPKVKIQAGNISGAPRDQIQKIFSQTPPPIIDAMGYETLKGGSNVYDDFKLMFDTLYDITTDRLQDYKINYPLNANFSISDVPVGFSDNQQAISYITGITSTAVVTNIQANKTQNTAPIKYFILGTFTNDDNLKNALITKFLNDFIKNQAVLVWPWTIIENGDMYWNDYFPEKSKSIPIIGIIGKAGNDYYSLLTNMSGNSVAVNFTADMNFSAYKFYSSQRGMGNFASSNQISFAPYETIIISKYLDGDVISANPTTTISTQTQPISIKNGDLNSYPKPKYDTGIGMHWAADGENDTSNAKNSVCTLKDMGVSWIKLLAVGPSALDLAKIMEQNYIEPIVRLYRYQPLPSTMPQPDIDAVGEYVKNGIYYFESTNEPNIRTEWQNEALPDCNSAVNQTMQAWTKDALHIQQKGGIPLFPALSPGGVCDDVNFLRDSFNWLKTNTCELADGSNGSCLGLFDADKSNGKPAVMSIHNYNFNHDNSKNGDGSVSFYTEDSNAFLKFSTYNQIINENLGRSIPILATEGGMHVGDNPDPRFPTTDNGWHRDVNIAMSEYQMNNQAPYFFNTAFWLAMPNPDGNWSANAWFNRDLSPRIPETVNALKNLSKKTRNGETYPSACNFINPSPSPTQRPNTTSSPTLNPRLSPSPTSNLTPGARRPSPTSKPKKNIINYVAFPCPTIPGIGLQLGCILFATPTPK